MIMLMFRVVQVDSRPTARDLLTSSLHAVTAAPVIAMNGHVEDRWIVLKDVVDAIPMMNVPVCTALKFGTT